MKQQNQISKIKSLVNGYKSTYIMITAARIGLFAELNKTQKSAKEIAKNLHLETRKIEPLLNALAYYGIIEKNNNEFMMIDYYDILSPNSEINQLGYVNHALNMSIKWQSLEKIVKDEAFAKTNFSNITGQSKNETRSFLEAMNTNALPQANYIINSYDFTNHKFIDIGAGFGTYSLKIAEKFKTSHGIAFDLPLAANIIQDNVNKSNLSNQITVISGDYKSDLPNEKFDDVLLFAVIHQENDTELEKLLSNSFDLLNTGGKLYLTSFFLNDDKINPEFSVLFAVEMVVGSEYGKAYSHKEIQKHLRNSGFKSIEKVTEIPGPATLYIATK